MGRSSDTRYMKISDGPTVLCCDPSLTPLDVTPCLAYSRLTPDEWPDSEPILRFFSRPILAEPVCARVQLGATNVAKGLFQPHANTVTIGSFYS